MEELRAGFAGELDLAYNFPSEQMLQNAQDASGFLGYPLSQSAGA